MVVLNENPPFKNIACDGYKTSFDTPKYAINAPEELKVLFTDSSNAQFTLEYGIDYTINEFGNPDGTTITFPMEGSSYSVGQAGDILSLLIDPPIIQEKPYQDTGSVLPSALERSLDYITKICSSLSRKIERCVKVQEGLSINPDELMDNLYQSASQAASSASSASSAATIAAGQAASSASSAATIAAGLAQLNGIGDLEDLDTTAQDTLVEAINEVVADVSDLNPDIINLGTVTISTINLTANTVHTAHITTNATIVLPTLSTSKPINVMIDFTIASGKTLTLPSGVKYPYGVTPTFSATAGTINRLVFDTSDSGTTWMGYYSQLVTGA